MQVLPRLAPGHALFLDFDGTLVDIAPQPDAVRVERGVIPALQALHEYLEGALAIITGRTLVDIDHYLAPLKLDIASEHGASYRMSGVDSFATAAEHSHADLQPATQYLQTALQQYPDLLLEPKTSGLALHYRNAPALEPIAEQLMNHVLGTLLPHMELLRGKYVLELKPSGPSKGRAVRDFMQRHPAFKHRMPIFIGDDITDESAFAAAQQLGGWGLKVGPGESQAMARCESAAQVREWLLHQQRETQGALRI